MKKLVILGSALVLLLAGIVPASAQSFGSISGTVSSASGEALPGVTVTATGNTLPRPRTVVTNSRGNYSLPALPPGDYEVTYTLDGMATAKRSLKES